MTDDELRALVGCSTGTTTVVVERGAVTNFARAVCDDDPVYRDPAAARAAGLDSIPAPPTYAIALAYWGAFPELQPLSYGEPTGYRGIAEVMALLKASGGLILHGEQEFVYHRPILVGDRLRGASQIVNAYTKQSKGHTMTFVVDETVWRDDTTGDPVVTVRFNVIHRA
jgi:acyl dehydratase